MRISEGKPYPLGATADETGANFAVFSANATRVEVCLFDSDGRPRDRPFRTSGAYRRSLPRPLTDVGPATFYGFRVHGPYEPEAGHRFNPNKLLLDPYARAHAGKLTWDPAVFGYTLGAEDGDLSFDERDSAPFVPKSVIVDPNFDWRGEYQRRSVPWATHHHLRDARQGLHPVAPGGRREAERLLCRTGLEACRRLHQVARRDDRRADAGPHLHRRQPPARKGPQKLLGL